MKCKHKVIICNPMFQKYYCKKCKKLLHVIKDSELIDKRIKENKVETSYNVNAKVKNINNDKGG